MTLSLRWKKYAVSIEVTNRVVGGIPTSPKLIEGWLKGHMPQVSEAERAELATKTAAELPELVEEKAQGMWTTFKADKVGPYLESRQLKAMFKEAANILKGMLEKSDKGDEEEDDEDEKKPAKKKYTNLRSKLAERLFVLGHKGGERIYFLRDGKPLGAADGDEERAIHVMTAMGPRNALKRYDFIGHEDKEPVTLDFTLRVLDDGLIKEDLIEVLLEYAGQNGLGADRSQGNGLFQVKKFEALKK